MSKTQLAPIFEEFSIEELSRRLDVTEYYIVELKRGDKPIRPKFRTKAAAILNRSIAELFGEDPVPTGEGA